MGKRRVLYAEDEIANRELLHIKLEKEGIDCDVVKDGIQAIEKCRNIKYDLIILDHYMPGLDGVQTAEIICKIDPDVPMIAITSDDELIEPLLEKGFSEVIIKPLRGNKIVGIVQSYFRN